MRTMGRNVPYPWPLLHPFAPLSTPRSLRTFAELGISEWLVLDLMLRRMLIEGYSSMAGLSRSLRLSIPIIDLAFKHMRQQQLVEIKGMIGQRLQFHAFRGRKAAGGRALPGFAIRRRVPGFAQGLSTRRPRRRPRKFTSTARLLRQAFSDLVVTDHMLDQLGPAIISQNFDLRLRAHRQRKDQPRGAHAARLSGRGADSVRGGSGQPDHQLVRSGGASAARAMTTTDVDPRWVLCKRPCIVVGGELIPSMLELRLDEASGHLRRAAADEGQQRHSDHRRLRPPVDVAARSAESLDRAARSARRLPDAALRREIPDSVRD